MPARREILELAGREVTVTNPDKVYFPQSGHTKLDLVRYYLSVADGALRGVDGRPMALKRYVNGDRRRGLLPEAGARQPARLDRDGRAAVPVRPARPTRSWYATPPSWPGWSTWAASTCTRTRCAPTTSTTRTSCGSTSTRCPAWPGPRCARWRWWSATVLADFGLAGWPKTSGSRGMHIYCRIAAALDVHPGTPGRRSPWRARSSGAHPTSPPAAGGRRSGTASSSTTTRTPRTAPPRAAYSVRPTPDARVSTPLTWDEVPTATRPRSRSRPVPERLRDARRPVGRHRRRPGSLDALLDLAARQKAAGSRTRRGHRTRQDRRRAAPGPAEQARRPGEGGAHRARPAGPAAGGAARCR